MWRKSCLCFWVSNSHHTFQQEKGAQLLADSPVQSILEELHAELSENLAGEVATYIPELGKADPNWFGICVVMADGQIYEVGDVDRTFTIQSISKPFVYGMALEDNGTSKVLVKIWMEPTGEAFNAISLRPETGQPANPMINAGAIATTSLVEGGSTKQKIHRIMDSMGRYCGRSLCGSIGLSIRKCNGASQSCD